jgi:hypothetical protein
VEVEAPPPEEAPAAPQSADSPVVVSGAGGALPVGRERLIIKNGEMTLLVEDTDVTIDRLAQVVGDLGGYIISSRVWYQERQGDEYKYATVTLAVPASEFENALRRLRGLAIIVTDEFVDLESRLRNLEATRDRIREFLDKARTVEEALEVNEQLSNVEDKIEQVQGRMNYLVDRASFSTITVQIEPDVPILTPTPTPAPTTTPTPTATPTPTPWRPGKPSPERGMCWVARRAPLRRSRSGSSSPSCLGSRHSRRSCGRSCSLSSEPGKDRAVPDRAPKSRRSLPTSHL